MAASSRHVGWSSWEFMFWFTDRRQRTHREWHNSWKLKSLLPMTHLLQQSHLLILSEQFCHLETKCWNMSLWWPFSSGHPLVYFLFPSIFLLCCWTVAHLLGMSPWKGSPYCSPCLCSWLGADHLLPHELTCDPVSSDPPHGPCSGIRCAFYTTQLLVPHACPMLLFLMTLGLRCVLL